MFRVRAFLAFVLGFLSFGGVSVPAYAATATTLDYSGITGAIDLTSTIAAIMAVGGLVALVSVAVMGVRKVLRMIR